MRQIHTSTYTRGRNAANTSTTRKGQEKLADPVSRLRQVRRKKKNSSEASNGCRPALALNKLLQRTQDHLQQSKAQDYKTTNRTNVTRATPISSIHLREYFDAWSTALHLVEDSRTTSDIGNQSSCGRKSPHLFPSPVQSLRFCRQTTLGTTRQQQT